MVQKPTIQVTVYQKLFLDGSILENKCLKLYMKLTPDSRCWHWKAVLNRFLTELSWPAKLKAFLLSHHHPSQLGDESGNRRSCSRRCWPTCRRWRGAWPGIERQETYWSGRRAPELQGLRRCVQREALDLNCKTKTR